jgi:hypothetical protein
MQHAHILATILKCRAACVPAAVRKQRRRDGGWEGQKRVRVDGVFRVRFLFMACGILSASAARLVPTSGHVKHMRLKRE